MAAQPRLLGKTVKQTSHDPHKFLICTFNLGQKYLSTACFLVLAKLVCPAWSCFISLTLAQCGTTSLLPSSSNKVHSLLAIPDKLLHTCLPHVRLAACQTGQPQLIGGSHQPLHTVTLIWMKTLFSCALQNAHTQHLAQPYPAPLPLVQTHDAYSMHQQWSEYSQASEQSQSCRQQHSVAP